MVGFGDTRIGSPAITTELLVILALVLLNGIFAGAEIAVLSVRRTRLAELLEDGGTAARALAALRQTPDRFLATVQIGITVVSASAAAFGGASLAEELAPILARVPGMAPVADKLAFGVVVAGVSYLSLVLGELVPKSLALRYGESYALFIGRPLVLVAWLATPAVWLLTASSNVVLRLFGDRTTFSEARLSREELQQLMDEAATSGSVDPRAGEIASRALAFDELDASDVMVARADIQCVQRGVALADLAELARTGAHARAPVIDGGLENIVGMVNIREALADALVKGRLDLDGVLHPVPFVGENMSAPAVLRELQARRSHMAMVVDEQGTVRGLVTLEDLLEELVGEIFSENDAPQESLRREADGSAILPGGAPVHEVNRELGIELPEGETFSTIAGLCIELAGRIPAQGEILRADEHRIEVLDASPRRVRLVRLTRVQASEG